jgi:hypothetical protein
VENCVPIGTSAGGDLRDIFHFAGSLNSAIQNGLIASFRQMPDRTPLSIAL